MKVLHLELGRHLYGGARQVVYLLDGLADFPGDHVLVCAAGAEIEGALRNPQVAVRPLPVSGDLDLRLPGRLGRILRAERPDLLHVHSRRCDLHATLAGRRAGLPMVYSRRVDNPPRWLDRRLKFPLFRRIIGISQGICDVLRRSGVPGERVVCVPSAIDTESFHPDGDRAWFCQEFGIARDAPVLGIVAQLIPRKGHRVLFQALPVILSHHPQVRVLVFGQGPLRAELECEIVRAALGGTVQFAGFRTDLARILPCLDLVVHPAYLEGLGVSLLEAAACAVPIVASRTGGIPEAVRDGLNGYLIEPGDAAGLAERVCRLLAEPARARNFGEAGRRLVLEEFAIARMVAGNYRVYREVLQEQGSGASAAS